SKNREIKIRKSRRRSDVASRVPQLKWTRLRDCGRVVVQELWVRHCWRGLNSATLLIGKHDALAGHDIGTLQDASNRREGDKAAQVLWVAILKRKDRRNLPGSNHVRQPSLLEKTLPLAKGKLVDQSR